MDEVITRILEIERQCVADIDQARTASARRIEEHRRACEAQKEEERRIVLSSEKARRDKAIDDAGQKIQAQTAAFLKDGDRFFDDGHIQARIKEEMLGILFEA